MKEITLIIFCLLLPGTLLPFELLWQVEVEEWAHMGIIHNGVIYNQWSSAAGSFTAIDLKTGQVLHRIDNVADATAPFIVGNKIYSFDDHIMHEIDINTFQETRAINVPNANYSENIPYDPETGYYFTMRATNDYKGCVSAVRVSDGQIVWSYPAQMTGGFDGMQAPIVVGDSLYVYICNASWQYGGQFFRINKTTGQLVWVSQLTPAASRGAYNNPIYDEDHDVFYVSESWNGGTSKVWAIRRSDGTAVW